MKLLHSLEDPQLIVFGALGVFGAGFLFIATAGFAFGPVGAWVAVGLVALGICGFIRALTAPGRQQRRADRERNTVRHNAVADFPDDVAHLVDTLVDDDAACHMWSGIGLGKPAELRGGRLVPGEWPRLEPSTNSFPADSGIWEEPAGLRVRLRMARSQRPRDFITRLDSITSALDVHDVQVVDHRGQVICLDLVTRDTLATPLAVPVPAEPVNLLGIDVGKRQDLKPWLLRIDQRHTLVVGLPGSGKSRFLRAILAAMAPAARDGHVVQLMIDCKFGIEARAVRGLLHDVAPNPAKAARMLRWLRHEVVEKRGRYMEANGLDTHIPTIDEPNYVLHIDEIAELLDDPDLRGELIKLLVSCLRLGRAMGLSIIGYTQTPNKKNLDLLRDLFQNRVGFRLASPEQIAMVYGDHSAAERGAGNIELPDFGAEGIAFVAEDGTRKILRVRGYDAPREVMAWFAEQYPPYPHAHVGKYALTTVIGQPSSGGPDVSPSVAASVGPRPSVGNGHHMPSVGMFVKSPQMHSPVPPQLPNVLVRLRETGDELGIELPDLDEYLNGVDLDADDDTA